ncbi:MAG: hypothetical protein Q8M83_06095 [bacterium]|nr:hypothetical protein [bacterium]
MSNSNEVTTNEIMEFLKEHMVMKEDFDSFRGDFNVLKSDFNVLKNDFESFKGNTEKRFDSIDASLFEIRQELQSIRERLDALDLRTKEDADAEMQDILELRRRVELLEKQIRQLQLSQS